MKEAEPVGTIRTPVRTTCSRQPSEQDRIAFFRSLLVAGARQHPVTGGTNQCKREKKNCSPSEGWWDKPGRQNFLFDLEDNTAEYDPFIKSLLASRNQL